MKTIVLSHPWHGSFNKAILDAVVEKCKAVGEPYQIIDLHKDGFNATYSQEELSHYNTGYTEDKLILKYQDMIRNTTDIVFNP